MEKTHKKILGIDYGTKRVGLALSDTSGTLAFPYDVVRNTRELTNIIKNICEAEGVVRIVMGESKDLKGTPNSVMGAITHFIEDFKQVSSIPIVLQEEFFTSVEADKISPSKEHRDAQAAALILQRYLDIHTH